MTRSPRSTFVAGACAALLALAGVSAAVAQQPSPAAAFTAAASGQDAQGAQDARAQWRSMTPEQRQQARQQRHAQKAAALKQKLAIAPDQEGAWASFQQAMQPAAGQARAQGQRQDWKQLTTPERIDRMRELRTQRMAEQDRRGDAVKAFYATLKPEQQKTFDAEGMRMMGQFGKKGGHHGGMRHGQHHGAQQ